jgi:glycosyltransferase involved in cell wall biosynthesis
VSDHTRREFVASGLPPESVAVVHLGIDTSRFAPNPAVRATVRREHGWDDDAPVVLYAGRIDREKGLETLLDAWRVLSSEHPRARLVVVGGPRNHASPSAAMAYVAELERRGGPGVIWLPRRTDVTSLYAAADVVVLPSVYAEPSGRTILEGMATGVPVVASNVGGIPEFYDVSLTELLCPAGDAGALVATLRRVLTWRTALPSLGPMCRANAERFPVSAAVDGVDAVIEDAVRHHRARRHRARRRALWQWGRPSR